MSDKKWSFKRILPQKNVTSYQEETDDNTVFSSIDNIHRYYDKKIKMAKDQHADLRVLADLASARAGDIMRFHQSQRQGYVNEISGPKGLEPTRFGDWEKNGRCIDF